MQPNQSYPPAPDLDQNNEPPVNPASQPSPWDVAPQTPPTFQQPQSVAPAQSPVPVDYTRYQPQPQAQAQPQSLPVTPAQPVTQQEYAQSQQITPAQPTAPTEYTQPPAPTPLSPFEQHYQAVLQTPAPKKSRVGLIIAGSIAAILLIGGGVAAFMWMQYTNSPEQRLYRALESHMQTTYIQQDYAQSVKQDAAMAVNIQGTSNFTDPKSPQSYIKYEIKSDETTTHAGELTVLNDKEYFAKLSQQSDSFAGMGSEYLPAPKQWYRVDTGDFGGALLLDPASLATTINVPTGEVIVGNFDSNVRQELMAFIKEKGVYTIKNSADVTIDGKKTTRLDLDINTDQLKELNKKVRKILNISEDSAREITISKDQTNQLWISHETGRIVKVELTRDSASTQTNGSKTKDTSTIKISYPTSAAKIAKPGSTKEVPWKDLMN
jgi:hypothetical protein